MSFFIICCCSSLISLFQVTFLAFLSTYSHYQVTFLVIIHLFLVTFLFGLPGHLHNHVGLTENFDQSENEEFLVNDSP